MPTQQEAGIVIYPIRRLLDFSILDGGEVRALREEPAYKLVLLLVGPTLPWGAWVAVVHLGAWLPCISARSTYLPPARPGAGALQARMRGNLYED